MKKYFLFIMASLMTLSAMAIGDNDGSTKANAKEFDWDKGVTHPGGTLWYRVDLAPLYEEENPSLTLYLTNPSNVVGSTVDVSMKATVAGQEESKDYTIAARQYKTYTANAKALITLHQTEIYLTLTSNGVLKLSAKVFEAADLDESCKDARTLKWGETAVQNPMYSAWWKVSLKPIKDASNLDAQVTITNTGSKTVTLKIGQSLDCPSSGMTKREYTLAPGEPIVKKIPRDMIASVQPDELYFGVENVESQVSILVETVPQPPVPVIPSAALMPGVNLHVTDTIEPLPTVQTLYKISVADMDSMAKYEPEFTYRNVGFTPAKVTIQMAFSRPAFGTSDTEYDLQPGEEEIVVYKKNMLEGMDGVDSIYLLTTVVGEVNFYGRFKHVREGKACKTNIDFNWEGGHTQEGRTTQWYAINVADARERMKDIMVYVLNQGNGAANVKASMAFSCPYIDLTEMSRTLSANGDVLKRRLGFSSYAMMSDTIWIGLETNQEIRFWADTIDAEKKAVVDSACLNAVPFNWEEGVVQNAKDTVWYLINMAEVREKAAKFPTVFVQNMSSSAAATITAELSVECPDSIANQSRTMTIAANDSYSKKLARNMFENIVQDEIYLRVVSTEKISLQIRLNEEAEGTSCASAIPFNWTSGNAQAANNNLWYKVDLREVMKGNKDLNLSIENKDAAACEGVGQLTFGCPDEEAPSVQSFTLTSKQKKTIFRPHSALQLLPDSVIYINLQGNTAMHISAEMVTPAPFTPITGSGIVLDTLLLDSKNSTLQNNAEQWYLVPKEEIQHMRDTIQVVPLTPNVHLENTSAGDLDVTIDVAFAFPVTETMMSQKVTVPAGKAFVHALDYKLFKQAITKFDSVLVRITVPAGGEGKLRIRSGLDKAFNGNTRETASPILIGEEYVQEGNTTMWYKLKTSDLKKDLSLINKRINVKTANLGSASTTVKVAVYEGLQAKVDMLEQFALESYRERKIPAGEGRNRSLPFQNLLLVGDVELYIQVTTTQKIMFRTKVDGEYAAIAPDPAQQEALLLVPNVDYMVPGDNQPHWYQICIPYIRNNYKYVHASSLTYTLEKEATIEALNTFMDTMTYNFPSRKRTVNKANKHYVDTKPLSDLIAKGLSKVTDQKLDITTFQENFIDSMLHRYVTSDSITMYIRYKTNADMKVRLNMPQITGDSCLNPVIFDWEHGNVNQAKSTNWYQVKLDPTRVPEGKDLMIHMDNWTDAPTNVEAKLYVATCKKEDELGKVKKLITKDTTKVLERQFLEQELGWSDFMIEYYSDSTTHIWAELIDPFARDTVDSTLDVEYVCPMTDYRVKYAPEVPHIIDPSNPLSWTFDAYFDSIFKTEAKIVTYHMIYNVLPYDKPNLISIDSLTNKPIITIGAQVQEAASTTEIFNRLKALQGDTLMPVAGEDSIQWEYSMDGNTFTDFPTPVLTSASIALRYKVITVCDDTIYGDPYLNIVRDTLKVLDNCGPYTWEGYTYETDTLDSVIHHLSAYGLDSIAYLKLTIKPNEKATENVSVCKLYVWSVTGDTLYKAGVYKDTTLNTESGCYDVSTLNLTFRGPEKDSATIDTCYLYEWKLSDGLDSIIYDSGIYYHTIDGKDECDTVVKLDVKIGGKYSAALTLVPKYGNRLLLIHRKEINDNMPGWYLEEEDTEYVSWFKDGMFIGNGFYYTKPDGSVLDPGTYYATVDLPSSAGAKCGAFGKTQEHTVSGAAPAPALMPSLARPGEDIRVVNLDPEQTTTIRVYTYDGTVYGSYTVSGQEEFTIKAAADNGFYLVELYSDSYKSTLRYIVK